MVEDNEDKEISAYEKLVDSFLNGQPLRKEKMKQKHVEKLRGSSSIIDVKGPEEDFLIQQVMRRVSMKIR